ncbi:uncharacterized protein LOC100568638 [Acyrthosiphon pisum]|uniref:PARP catalytic domain-containing protein n=1 Tax=Acyrthosiphon pisum TaxID=7029 RepID=A0A8R1W8A8_ACYPI|nr:uncharacterized protein LOC100568638 [Acyrthosiphon pisum]XP_003244413.1 uncharacterized protein LOC100568638 [Acyrthosiphon pisum]|eukprot:XP_003244412.1 PREDICTED: uncharacterized protein LOC100568638 [Acyrthosiphon pisum]
MANTTTRSYGKTPTLSSDFSTHAMALLRRRHNSSPNSQSARLDSSLKFKEIRRIKREIHDTFPDCYVEWIERVNLPEMYGMYLLRKEEMQLENGGADGVKEMLLYHVTTKSRALKSLKSGLDWRLTRRSRYGCGVSFSEDAEYADKYADNSTRQDERVIMICSVLVKETYVVNHKWNEGNNLIAPPGTADTTVSSNGNVYVKYNDFDFYPLHLVYYSYQSEYDDYDEYDDNYYWPNPFKTFVFNIYNGFYQY